MLRIHPRGRFGSDNSAGIELLPVSQGGGSPGPGWEAEEEEEEEGREGAVGRNMEHSGAGGGLRNSGGSNSGGPSSGSFRGVPGVSVTAPMLPNSNSLNNQAGHMGNNLAAQSSSKRPWWYRITKRYVFPNEDLETIYQKYIFNLRVSSIVALLVLIVLLTATLAILNFLFVSHVTVENIYHIAQCVIFIFLLIYIHTKYMKENHLIVINIITLFLCVCFSVIALPVDFGDRPVQIHTPADGVWQITLVIFLIYALMPLKIYIAIGIGMILPIAHVLVSVFLTHYVQWLLWREVSPF